MITVAYVSLRGPEVFRRKREPASYLNVFYVFLFDTQEEFKARQEESWQRFSQHLEAGTADKAVRGQDTPREIWEGFSYVAKMRDRLMECGWLPPRISDVKERFTAGGLFLEKVTKWEVERKYTPSDLGYSNSKFFFED